MEGSKKCPNCGKNMEPRARFCEQCGWQLPVREPFSIRNTTPQNCLAPQPTPPVIKGTLINKKEPDSAQIPEPQKGKADANTADQEPKPVAPPIVSSEKPEQPLKEKHSEKEKRKGRGIVAAALLLSAAMLLSSVMISFGRCNGETPGVLSATPEETTSGQRTWSDQVEALPDHVTAENYEIEEITLYSTREVLETKTSTTQNSMGGWELYDTAGANDEYGPWSDWSETKVEASETRQVKTETRYHYQDKETSTGSSPNLNGWTLYNTTYSWGSYGGWSGWSTTPAYSSESRQVNTKTQYRYCNISYSTEYTEWSSWGPWTIERQSTSNLKKEESSLVWPYYYYLCPNCGAHMYAYGKGCCYKKLGGCGGNIPDNFVQVWTTVSWDSVDFQYVDAGSLGPKYYATVEGQRVFKWSSKSPYTQYRYATRSTKQVANYGGWSDWGDTAYSNSSTRKVETRTVYQYCDRPQIATYHFYRWSEWSDWSATAVTATEDRQVEQKTFYSYCDKITTTTYYFRRWSDWSDYTEKVVEPSDTMEVQTKTVYRYREK